MSNATQADLVYDYLKQFGSITPMAALSELGVARLAARIYDLRKQGVEIESETVTSRNRRGDPVSFKKYKLAKTAGTLFDLPTVDQQFVHSTRGER